MTDRDPGVHFKRGPAVDTRLEIYFLLIRRYGFERVMAHIDRLSRMEF